MVSVSDNQDVVPPAVESARRQAAAARLQADITALAVEQLRLRVRLLELENAARQPEPERCESCGRSHVPGNCIG